MVHIVRNIDMARLSAYIRDLWYINVKRVQPKSYNKIENEEEEREREREREREKINPSHPKYTVKRRSTQGKLPFYHTIPNLIQDE